MEGLAEELRKVAGLLREASEMRKVASQVELDPQKVRDFIAFYGMWGKYGEKY